MKRSAHIAQRKENQLSVLYYVDGMAEDVQFFTSLDIALYSAGCHIEGVGILDEETARAHMDAEKADAAYRDRDQ